MDYYQVFLYPVRAETLGSSRLELKREAIETVKTFSEENFVGCINSLNAILKVQHGIKTFQI